MVSAYYSLDQIFFIYLQSLGFNPTWDETFRFTTEKPELTFVEFTLTNNDNFYGNYMITLQLMKKGLSVVSQLFY